MIKREYEIEEIKNMENKLRIIEKNKKLQKKEVKAKKYRWNKKI